MELIRTFKKLILLKNIYKIYYNLLAIGFGYLIIVMLTIYINLIQSFSSDLTLNSLHSIMSSIQTIFWISGISYIIYQYYKLMESCIGDYSILKSLGAKKKQLQLLIFIQTLLLVITMPIGLFAGNYLVNCLCLGLNIHDNKILQIANMSLTFYLLSAIISTAIFLIGIDLEKNIRRLPPNNIYNLRSYQKVDHII